jgi:hypothetical protein
VPAAHHAGGLSHGTCGAACHISTACCHCSPLRPPSHGAVTRVARVRTLALLRGRPPPGLRASLIARLPRLLSQTSITVTEPVWPPAASATSPTSPRQRRCSTSLRPGARPCTRCWGGRMRPCLRLRGGPQARAVPGLEEGCKANGPASNALQGQGLRLAKGGMTAVRGTGLGFAMGHGVRRAPPGVHHPQLCPLLSLALARSAPPCHVLEPLDACIDHQFLTRRTTSPGAHGGRLGQGRRGLRQPRGCSHGKPLARGVAGVREHPRCHVAWAAAGAAQLAGHALGLPSPRVTFAWVP